MTGHPYQSAVAGWSVMNAARTILVAFLVTIDSARLVHAGETGANVAGAPLDPTPQTICELIEHAAIANGIPIDFFTRLIWKESTFRQEAVSPKGAQGIAQFMPGTAALRGLGNPFDADQAIPASATYLSELVRRFGNLGLAAAAYNAGEARVTDWLAGAGGLPSETREYVVAISGRSADDWTRTQRVLPMDAALPLPADIGCLTLTATLGKPDAAAKAVSSVPSGPSAPWGVQVAGDFSLSRAMAGYASVQRSYGGVLGTQPPMVIRTIKHSRGTAPLFQIRVPAGSADEANAICRRLHALGGACLVTRS